MWLWAQPLKEERKKNPHCLLKPSPSWRHSPPQGSSRHSQTHVQKATGNTTWYNNLDAGQITCCPDPKFSDAGSLGIRFYFILFSLHVKHLFLNMSVCWLWVICLLSQCLGCMIDSCKYICMIYFVVISACSSCLETPHCMTHNRLLKSFPLNSYPV